MDEHGAAPVEEDFSSIPLPERSIHKNWRARLSAYTDLIARFAITTSDNDPFFRIYISDPDLLKKWGTDSQVVAQEKGVEALGSLVRESGEGSAKLRPEVLPAVIEKTFGSTRASLKLKAFELVMLWIEVEGTADGIVGDVIKGLDSKQPKIVASSVTCLREIVSSFGIKTLGNPKPLLKTLPKIFGHTDKTVRAEGTLLVQQLHLFIGDSLIPFLQELKPIQIQELISSFDGVGLAGSGVQKRFTRQQQKDMQERELAASGETEPEAPEAFVIVPDAAPPVDILSVLPSDFYEALASAKWKERLDALTAVSEKLGPTPNLIDGDFTDMLSALAKRMTDANINVVTAAAAVIEGLAKGLGKKFGKNKALVMMPMIEKLKERKVSVTDALGAALDAVFASTSFSEITDDVLTGLKSKNPQVKEGTLKFLNRSLKSTLEAPPPASIKPLTDALSTCAGDSFEPVRAASAESMGLLMKIVGERAFGPVLEGLDDMRKTKVREQFEKAEVKFKAGGAPVRSAAGAGPSTSAGAGALKPVAKKPAAPKPKPLPATPPPEDDEPNYGPPVPLNKGSGFGNEFPDGHSNGFGSEFPEPGNVARPPVSMKKPVAKLVVKKAPPPGAAPVKKAPPPPSAKAKTVASSSPSEPLKYKFNAEEAEARWEELIPADLRTEFADGNWKIRLEAGDKMTKWLEEGAAESADSEVVIRFWAKIPGWSEKNFQVSSKIYGMMVLLAERSPSFSKACIALTVAHLTEKLGDIKLKKPAGDALVAFSEKISLAFVLAQAFDPMAKAKSPKTQADALVWVNQALLDFGVAGIPLRDLIEFLKTGLKSSNAAVRASATKTLVTLKIFVGNDVSTFLDDLNPQLLTTINNEFAKVDGQTPAEPTRFSAELKVATAGGKAAKGGVDPMDELIPRLDLDKLVGSTSIVANSRDDAWKVRKEAMGDLQSILIANTRLKGSMSDIGGALKARLADTNIMVKLAALDCISKIAIGMGKPFEKHVKLFTGPVCTILADAKPTNRAAASNVLTAMANAVEGIDLMIPSFGTSLEGPNPMLRATLFAWLAERFAENDPATLDLTPIIGPVIASLEDRAPDVRKQAQVILPIVVASVGVDFAMEQTSKLKPAMRQSVIPIIQAARSAKPTLTASSSNGSVPPPPSSAPALPPSSRPTPAAAKAAPPLSSVAAPPPAKPRGIMSTGSLPTSSRPSSRASSNEDAASSSKYKPSTGLRRPVSVIGSKVPSSSRVSSSASSTLAERSSAPFRTSDPGPKALRAKKDASKWVFNAEKAEPHHTELLASQMEPHASPELFALLFSRDHNASVDFVKGIEIITACFVDMAKEADKVGMDEESLRNIMLANLDLILKYAVIRMYDSNTVSTLRSIELIASMIGDFSSGGLDAPPRHSFDDYELQLILPTMISKLGNVKFQVTIQDLFKGKMRYVVPSSKLFQILVAHGLPNKNSKARAEALKAMQIIVRQNGTETTLNKDSVSAILRCLGDADSKVRSAALDVLGEAYKKEGEAVYDYAPVGKNEREQMEGRFKHTQGPAPPPGRPDPVARVLSDAGSSRPGSPAGSRISRVAVRPESPMVRAPIRTTSPQKVSSALTSPFSPPRGPSALGLPRGPAPPGSRLGAPATSRLPTSAFALALPSSSSLQPPASSSSHAQTSNFPSSDPFSNPLHPPSQLAPPRLAATSQLPGPRRANSSGISVDVSQAIRAILASDPAQSVDSLKRVQQLLTMEWRRFEEHVTPLLQALTKQMKVVFVGPGDLREPRWFRLAKHLIQTLNNFCDHPELILEMDGKDMEGLLMELTLRLLETDDAVGDAKELSKFINMIILRIFNGGKREVVFQALFVLLRKVTIAFGDDTTAVSPQAKHAELILKCIWKRARSVEDDLGKNNLDPHALLRTIEEFLQNMPPTEWRRRAQTGVPMGDMPLRTVKVILQHIASKFKEGDQIYEVLAEAFEDPDNTHVYAYIFRLVTQAPQPAAPAPSASPSGGDPAFNSRPPSPPLPVVNRPSSAASSSSGRNDRTPRQSKIAESTQSSPSSVASSGDPVDQELQDLFRKIERGDNLQAQVEEVSKLLNAHPDKMAKFEYLVKAIDSSLSMFVRRAVGSRLKHSGSESPSAPSMSPSNSRDSHPTSPTTYGSSNFQSIPNSPSASSSTTGYSRPPSISLHSRSASMRTEEDDKLAKLKSQFFDIPTTTNGRSRAASQSNESAHSSEGGGVASSPSLS